MGKIVILPIEGEEGWGVVRGKQVVGEILPDRAGYIWVYYAPTEPMRGVSSSYAAAVADLLFQLQIGGEGMGVYRATLGATGSLGQVLAHNPTEAIRLFLDRYKNSDATCVRLWKQQPQVEYMDKRLQRWVRCKL